jgi:Protein of unknown function (Hypoth_ymh)
MSERLSDFESLCKDYAMSGPFGDSSGHRAISDEMAFRIPTVREILKRLDPELAQRVGMPTLTSGAYESLRAVQQGLGILRDQEEWTANLAPDAPNLVADQFHPHVWAAAAALWDTGRYRVAVEQATVSLSAHIASRAASHLTERELVAQVFSLNEPTAGQVRLHLPGDKKSKTWRSRQEGLHLIAQGAFAGIRNVATHTDDEWPEQLALEHLAILSTVARWADETQPASAS